MEDLTFDIRKGRFLNTAPSCGVTNQRESLPFGKDFRPGLNYERKEGQELLIINKLKPLHLHSNYLNVVTRLLYDIRHQGSYTTKMED